MKIYLDEPIEIRGIKIGLTLEGLKYRVQQYQKILTTARGDQLTDKERAHLKFLINNYNQHILLYEQRTTTDNTTSADNS